MSRAQALATLAAHEGPVRLPVIAALIDAQLAQRESHRRLLHDERTTRRRAGEAIGRLVPLAGERGVTVRHTLEAVMEHGVSPAAALAAQPDTATARELAVFAELSNGRPLPDLSAPEFVRTAVQWLADRARATHGPRPDLRIEHAHHALGRWHDAHARMQVVPLADIEATEAMQQALRYIDQHIGAQLRVDAEPVLRSDGRGDGRDR
jgi:hypothetical protein